MSNACEHGQDWDTDCGPCDSIGDRATADGALTPHEIGLWERGRKAGLADALGAARAARYAPPLYACRHCRDGKDLPRGYNCRRCGADNPSDF